jgi:hypothetical protein
MFQILAKPEYMPTFGDTAGPEEAPVEERLKYWIHTLLRPQALLLLGAWRCVVLFQLPVLHGNRYHHC